MSQLSNLQDAAYKKAEQLHLSLGVLVRDVCGHVSESMDSTEYCQRYGCVSGRPLDYALRIRIHLNESEHHVEC